MLYDWPIASCHACLCDMKGSKMLRVEGHLYHVRLSNKELKTKPCFLTIAGLLKVI